MMTLEVKKRLFYFIAFFLLTSVEVIIALVHDNFIRPYVGDIIIVVVIYCFGRSIEPKRIKLLPLYIFIFACGVEILQLFDFANMIGIKNNVLRVIFGSAFDAADILCYLIGCALLAVWKYAINQKQHLRHKNTR